MLKMLIAVDGSPHALRAIEAVAALARHGCALQAALLNVRDVPQIYGELPVMDIDALDRALAERQDELLRAAEQHAALQGLALLPSRRASGHVPAEIVREAAEFGADQIVMGTRGMGAVRSLFIGSTAQRVVHEASVPVLLTK